MEILVGCISVKEYELPCMLETLTLDESLGLSPGTDFVVIIEDRYGNKERQEVTSDGSGNLVIAIDRPERYNTGAGVFSLEVYDTNEEVVSLDLCGDTYTVINLRFIHFTGEAPDPVITCNAVP